MLSDSLAHKISHLSVCIHLLSLPLIIFAHTSELKHEDISLSSSDDSCITVPLLHNSPHTVVKCHIVHTSTQAGSVLLPLFAFQNKTPCICPDSPMLLTCCSLSLGRRPTHRFKVSMILRVSCSLACVTRKRGQVTHTHSNTLRG